MRFANLKDSRILIVDDQEANLKALAAVLEFAGCDNVKCLNDSREVHPTYGEFKPDLILLDLHMPHLDGLAVLDQLSMLIPEDDYIPVLVLTGDGSSEAKERALSHGASDFLSKPLNHTEVELRVRNLLQTRWLHRQLKEQNVSLERQVWMVAQQQEALAQSEAILRQQTKILQSILDSMGDGVIVADQSGKMVLLNPAAQQMVGPRADVSQSQWSSAYGIFSPDTLAPYPAGELPLAKALQGETVEATELYICNDFRPDGAFISVNGRPLRDDSGNSKGGVAVIRDITAAKRSEDLLRKAKDEAERANYAKSEFLSRMSHELRTPLNSILGFAQLLEMDALSGEQQDSVAHIMKGGQHLLSLINEVLDLARIEAGRLSLSAEPVHLHEVIQEALAFIRPIAQQRNIMVICDLTIDSVTHVKADRQRLRQVFLNLLSNAIKYNVESGRVNISGQSREGGVFRISISDTGQGISEKHQERLFQPFERVGEESTEIEGTGLGLALSRGLVEAMGGRIGVDSKLGLGSTFWIELSGVDGPEGVLADPADEPNVKQGEDYSQHRTVLYVEDNRANFRLMERIVAQRKKLRLIGAERGRIGLEMAGTCSPDLILLDLHLPDISGQEILDHLKDDPRTAEIPVVVVSADATPGQIDRLLAMGANSYLTKPLDVASILGLFDNTFTKPSPVHTVESSTQPK